VEEALAVAQPLIQTGARMEMWCGIVPRTRTNTPTAFLSLPVACLSDKDEIGVRCQSISHLIGGLK